MDSHVSGGGQQSHVQHPLARHNSWLGLTLSEVENHLGNLTKPLGTMNLDELLKKVWTTEANRSSGLDDINTSPAATLQRQASWSLAMAFTGKTVGEVWRDIQKGYKMRRRRRNLAGKRVDSWGDNFGGFLSKSRDPVMSLDSALKSEKFSSRMGLSPSPSIDELSDTPIRAKEDIWGL
ncbi:hypothetical protein DH2020_027961 [Rehmannia glutinosa]|uniref:Uncharacterized protein n=1 Tax=Rehmannia glutinosa TaxID=99300 RepID=A0ABR0VVF2_REHGL